MVPLAIQMPALPVTEITRGGVLLETYLQNVVVPCQLRMGDLIACVLTARSDRFLEKICSTYDILNVPFSWSSEMMQEQCWGVHNWRW